MTDRGSQFDSKLFIELVGLIKEDLKASPAELVYRTTIHIPGEFFQISKGTNTSDFVKDLRKKKMCLFLNSFPPRRMYLAS